MLFVAALKPSYQTEWLPHPASLKRLGRGSSDAGGGVSMHKLASTDAEPPQKFDLIVSQERSLPCVACLV